MLAWGPVMGGTIRTGVVTAVLAAALALLPAVALADAFDDVFADYRKDGKIEPCAHSEADLKAARDGIPNDIEQYAPDFPAELDQALEERARSGCKDQAAGGGAADTGSPTGGTPAGGTSTPPAQPNTPGQAPQPPGAATPADAAADGAIANAAARDTGSESEAPAPLVALAALAAVLLLGGLVWGVFRFFAWEPRWLLGARHAVTEAGWRASGTWADFTDWLRSRRSPA